MHLRHTTTTTTTTASAVTAALLLSAIQLFSPSALFSAPRAPDQFIPIATGERGLINIATGATGATGATDAAGATGATNPAGAGVALFLPANLPASRMPASLCLVARPKITAPLPAGWRPGLVPHFSFSAGRSRVTIPIGAGTSLYGTGEAVGPLLRNGQSNVLWNTDTPGYQVDDGARLYQSHPWVLAVRADGSAFGVIADTTWRAEIHLDGKIEITADGPSFPVIIIDRENPRAVLRDLAALTGAMPLPPRWALGFQQCRWTYSPDSRVREIASQFRARKIPCDAIWMDIDYMDGFRNFTFSPKNFPDPAALNAWLHKRGFKSVWMIDAGVKAGDPRYNVLASGNEKDVWTQDAFGAPYIGKVWPGPCVFPDFTRPETRAWWAALYRDFMAQGVDGVWNDMNEPSVFEVPGGAMPPHNLHRGGAADGDLPALEPNTHARYHNVYGMLEARATRDGILAANPGKRPFVLTRANYLGGQRYAATWTGDNKSTWEHLRVSVPMTLNLGLSGQPFNGPDLGGFGETATAELWGNWVGMGAFFPFARAHASKGTPPKEPWAFGAEVETAARTALERRYRLLPYYYTLFRESALDGMPVMRPVFFADTRDPALRAEEQAFLVGDDLLVVPKWAENPALPKGDWRLLSLVGENSAQDKYQADLRIRPGAIIPLGRVVQNTTEESLAPLTLLVSLDAQGSATGQLYEDAGDGFAYRDGDYLLTTYRATLDAASGEVTIAVSATEGHRARPARKLVVQLITAAGTRAAEGEDGQPVRVRAAAGATAAAAAAAAAQ